MNDNSSDVEERNFWRQNVVKTLEKHDQRFDEINRRIDDLMKLFLTAALGAVLTLSGYLVVVQ